MLLYLTLFSPTNRQFLLLFMSFFLGRFTIYDLMDKTCVFSVVVKIHTERKEDDEKEEIPCWDLVVDWIET